MKVFANTVILFLSSLIFYQVSYSAECSGIYAFQGKLVKHIKIDTTDADVQTVKAIVEECTLVTRGLDTESKNEIVEVFGQLSKLVSSSKIALQAKAISEKRTLNDEEKKSLSNLDKIKEYLVWKKNQFLSGYKVDIGWGKDFLYNFYFGIEGVSVGDLKNEPVVRTGFLVYNQLGGPIDDPERITNNDYTLGWFDSHIFMNMLLTGSAENTVANEPSVSESEVEPAVELDLNWFLARRAYMQSNGLLAFGPIFTAGYVRLSDSREFSSRLYGGFRLAHSAESYFDVLYGKSENAVGKRLELRGQLPVGDLGYGRVYVGLISNMVVGDNDPVNNTDTLRLYVTWQVTLDDLL